MNANEWSGAKEWSGGKWANSSTHRIEATTANRADADVESQSPVWCRV
ncbi:MAG: hypothetical protein QOK38_1142 [Acidobacteriaceae bacterium]|nr:hypothetical protein [Acidobacteriaceae bacterium]